VTKENQCGDKKDNITFDETVIKHNVAAILLISDYEKIKIALFRYAY
jgi:hypothetical protein